MIRRLSRLLPSSFVAAALALQASAGVHFVRADGSGDFTEVQAAVDAAQEGDVLMVGPGSYAGFVVDGKGLWITTGFDGRPEILGTVEVRGVPSGSKLVLAGLDGHPPTPPVYSGAPAEIALWVHDNAGHVRVQDCTFEGAGGADFPTNWTGATGGLFQANLSLVLDGCLFRGGLGGGPDPDLYCYCGEDGGDGAIFETSLAAAYGCTFRGGAGASIHIGAPAGDGGHGCIVPSYGLFAAGSSFIGGDGGRNDDFLGSGEAGDGGDGLVVHPGAQAQLLEDVYVAGAAGSSFLNNPGAPGQPTSGGGVLSMISGAARLLSGPSVALDDDPLGTEVVFTLTGAPGDEVWLAGGRGTSFQFALSKKGVWLVPRPALLPITPVATIPASGTIDVNVPVADLPPTMPAAGWLVQAFVRTAGGQIVLGAPQAVLVANCDGLSPDCNANTEWDTCDVLRGASSDCDGNLVPDECDPDCNGNMVPDACDIAGGEPDTNGNGVPDACEPANATWYVDPAAPPGGDGSAAFPFRTIREGVDAALSGDTVLLHDGLYTGPDNRALDFSSRLVVVRSQNGPASCVVDLQLSGRGFQFLNHSNNQAARIEGITFRNGLESFGGAIFVFASDPTIVDCVFESCQANGGGAVYLDQSASTVSGCRFLSNGNSGSAGGALRAGAVTGKAPRIVACTFESNQGVVGGALYVVANDPSWPVRIGQCAFLGNSAGFAGGGVGSNQNAHLTIDGCLFDNNGAPNGGGVGGWGVVRLASCTLVENRATTVGGALCREPLSASAASTLYDCVLWGNTAPSGAQIALRGSQDQLVVEFSDVQGGQAAVLVGSGAVLTWGTGNLDLDPLFVDPDGPDDLPGTYADNDWRLGPGSPCVDAGSNALVPPDRFDLDGDMDTTEPVPFDLLLQPRFRDDPAVPDTGSGAPPLVDVGAYERQP